MKESADRIAAGRAASRVAAAHNPNHRASFSEGTVLSQERNTTNHTQRVECSSASLAYVGSIVGTNHEARQSRSHRRTPQEAWGQR